MFIDLAKIYCRAGKGGKGVRSFYRDKFGRHPRPDGGDGGYGGDVVLKANPNIQTLLDFSYNRHFSAQNGGHGGSNRKKGARGGNCIIKVAPGTVIKDAKTGLILRDLKTAQEHVIACKGGRGGKGNIASKIVTDGEPGEEKELLLELKLIADVGVVGFPNAGKSSLISHISNARPRIASFPFTTKAPILGVVSRGNEHRFVAADIPGLIKGAHQGKGLGDRFLRHIERTKILIHVVDIAGVDGRNPIDDYKQLVEELGSYSKEIILKPQIIAANKIDLEAAKLNLRKFKKAMGQPVYPISCLTGDGIDKLLDAVEDRLKDFKEI